MGSALKSPLRSLASGGILLSLAACAPEGPVPGGSPLDGTYAGTGRVVQGPPYCGSASPAYLAMVVRNGEARIAMTSNAIEGPVAPDGDLGALRWTGRETVAGPPIARGRIAGGAFTLRYIHDNCTYEMEGRRR